MDIGIVRPVRIEDEMKGAYLDYAMSVITARALPDVRDGLKPVQRRILYSMDELSLRHTAAYKKSARIVGEVMGKYHPHGDAPVYEAMVRLAQDFSMRYQLVDGQGNFGSVDGDPPAAMRYTEARLASIAEEMLADIDKGTVAFAPNFDETLREPSVLPAKLPNLLVNGSAGIAVGMATNIPPHNLSEIVDALAYVIAGLGSAIDSGAPFAMVWGRAFGAPVDASLLSQTVGTVKGQLREKMLAGGKKMDADQRGQALLAAIDDLIDVPPDKLVEIIKGPDFPTAGMILGSEGIKNAYGTGHGRITIRAKVHSEDMRAGRTQLVVTELPYQVNKATLLEKIAELVRERRVDGISDLRDESDRHGMRIVIELKREAQVRQILNQLYKFTAMQTSFSMNLLALVDGQPRVLTLKMALLHYLNHRREVITRRTEFDLRRARERAHILEGLTIALDHLDEVIATIRRSKDADTARAALIKSFKLSELQAQAILDMQLRRLAALERQKIRDELAETRKLIARLEDLLANPVKILYLIRDELTELKAKYGDERRTRIVEEELTEFTEEDLVPEQDVVLAVSVKGYVRRTLADSFRLQRRGTKGIVGTVSREDDPPLQLVLTNTRDTLLLFSNRGRAFQVKVNDLPDAARQARGLPIGNFVSLDEQERVIALIPFRELENRFVVMATQRGEVKRVTAADYASARLIGIIGFAIPDGDELVGAVLTGAKDDVLLVTSQGQAIRFVESELRPSGRASGGVRGMRLAAGDRVIGIDIARAGGQVTVVTSRGFAKRTPVEEFSTQGRGGGGIRGATVSQKNGELVAAAVAQEGDELMITTSAGTVVRSAIGTIPTMGRSAQGAAVISLGKDEKVLAASVVPLSEKPPADGKGEQVPSSGPSGQGAAGLKGAGKVKGQRQGRGTAATANEHGRRSATEKGEPGKRRSPEIKATKAGGVAASKKAEAVPQKQKAAGGVAASKKAEVVPQKQKAAGAVAASRKAEVVPQKQKAAGAVAASKKAENVPQKQKAAGAVAASRKAEVAPQKQKAAGAVAASKKAEVAPQKQKAAGGVTASKKAELAPQKQKAGGAVAASRKAEVAPQKAAGGAAAPKKADTRSPKMDLAPENAGWRPLPRAAGPVSSAQATVLKDATPSSDRGQRKAKETRAKGKSAEAAPKTLIEAVAGTLAATLKKTAAGKTAPLSTAKKTNGKPKQPGLPL